MNRCLIAPLLLIALASNAQVVEIADTFDEDLAYHRTTTGNFLWTSETYGYFIFDSASNAALDYDPLNPSFYSINHIMSTNSYTLTVDVSYPNNTDHVSIEIFGRYDRTTGNAYIIEWLPDTGSMLLLKLFGNVEYSLSPPLFVSGTSHTLKLVLSGTTISGYYDGNLIASVTDTAISGAGRVGIGPGIEGVETGTKGNNHASYKNVQVTRP